MKNTRPRDTSANRARTDKNPAFQRFGKANGAHKHGSSQHAYRLKAGAKPNEVVHHKNHNHMNSGRSNLAVLKNTPGSSAMAKHNKLHPEKGRKAAAARKRG
jgi:hypothetical protein